MKSAILRKRREFGAGEREVTIHATEEALVIRYLIFRVTGASIRGAEIVPLRLAVLSRDVSGDLLLIKVEIILAGDSGVCFLDAPTDFFYCYSVAIPKRHERAAGQEPAKLPCEHERRRAIVPTRHVVERYVGATVADRGADIADAEKEAYHYDNECDVF